MPPVMSSSLVFGYVVLQYAPPAGCTTCRMHHLLQYWHHRVSMLLLLIMRQPLLNIHDQVAGLSLCSLGCIVMPSVVSCSMVLFVVLWCCTAVCSKVERSWLAA
jgi:hypothetical protein